MESQLWYVKWKGHETLLCFYCFDNKKNVQQMEVLIRATEKSLESQ